MESDDTVRTNPSSSPPSHINEEEGKYIENESLEQQDHTNESIGDNIIATQGIFAQFCTTSLEDSITDEVGNLNLLDSSNGEGDGAETLESAMKSSIHELTGEDSSSRIETNVLGSNDKKDNDISQRTESDEENETFEDAREVLHSPASDASMSPSAQSHPCLIKEIGKSVCVTSNEEWKFQPKHIFILSDAGKPIYSHHGDEDELASLMAVMQAHVSFVHDMDGDNIRAIHCHDCSIVFLNKGPLILVAVSRGMETVTQLIVQLTYMYHQVLSVVTLSHLTRIFEEKKNYDLRKMLAGSERLLDSLTVNMQKDPSFMLSAVRVLSLPSTTRDSISAAIGQSCGKVNNLVFAILIAENRLIALVRMKKYFIHPADLHLIFNLVNSSESFKHSENWTPICLPKFDSSGFMHAHVSYLKDGFPACLLMLTVERDAFFKLSEAKQKIVAALEKGGSLKAINDSTQMCKYIPSAIGIPDIKHFLYKSKTTAQYTGSEYVAPYLDGKSQERLQNIYLFLQGQLHASSRTAKLLYYTGRIENVFSWATQSFELYATFDALTTKQRAIHAMSKLVKWVKKEESSIFILSSPVF